jgi:hypothetical protein
MKKILSLFFFLCFITLKVRGQDSINVRRHFASIYGTTGLIQTSNTNTVGKFNGNIGVFENLSADSLDNLVFCFGVHQNIEVGIQSEIPSQPNPRMNFFFKIKGFKQGDLFGLKSRFFPSTAFGIHRKSAFAVASYAFRLFSFSSGYHFSDLSKGIFANFSFHPSRQGSFQCEFIDNTAGFGVRTYYRGIEFSLVYLHKLKDEKIMKENAYWRIAYNFSSGKE